MGKKQKDGKSGTRMLTTVLVSGVVFLLRKLLASMWTKVTGRVPPTDLTDPKVTLREALAWSIATGIVVQAVKFAIVRSTAKKSPAEAEAKSS